MGNRLILWKKIKRGGELVSAVDGGTQAPFTESGALFPHTDFCFRSSEARDLPLPLLLRVFFSEKFLGHAQIESIFLHELWISPVTLVWWKVGWLSARVCGRTHKNLGLWGEHGA